MALKAEARILEAEAATRTVLAGGRAELERLRGERSQAVGQAFRLGGRAAARATEGWYDEREAAVQAQYASLAVYAAYAGYDCITDPRSGHCLILNRTAVRVQHEDLR